MRWSGRLPCAASRAQYAVANDTTSHTQRDIPCVRARVSLHSSPARIGASPPSTLVPGLEGEGRASVHGYSGMRFTRYPSADACALHLCVGCTRKWVFTIRVRAPAPAPAVSHPCSVRDWMDAWKGMHALVGSRTMLLTDGLLARRRRASIHPFRHFPHAGRLSRHPPWRRRPSRNSVADIVGGTGAPGPLLYHVHALVDTQLLYTNV